MVSKNRVFVSEVFRREEQTDDSSLARAMGVHGWLTQLDRALAACDVYNVTTFMKGAEHDGV